MGPFFNAGRGAADTIFGFAVPEAGVYPMRLIWYEGGGGANVEWFTVGSDGTKTLINAEGGLKAYRFAERESNFFVLPGRRSRYLGVSQCRRQCCAYVHRHFAQQRQRDGNVRAG